MNDLQADELRGCSLLVAEDEYIIAVDLAQSLEHLGVNVIGPAASVREALELVEISDHIDGAVLDVNLREERVYPVADVLISRKIPFIFASGYDAAEIPENYAAVPRCEKPVNIAHLVRLLAAAGES
jgi:CheY-like chemotaxis protein